MTYNQGLPVKFRGVSFVTATLTSKDPQLGTRTYDSAGNEYVFMYNACNSQILPTYGVVVQSSVSTPFSMTLSSATSADIAVGLVKHATIPTANYGFVLTKGVGTVEMLASSGTVATNGLLELGANGLWAPRSNTTGNGVSNAKALEEIVTGASGSAFVNLF